MAKITARALASYSNGWTRLRGFGEEEEEEDEAAVATEVRLLMSLGTLGGNAGGPSTVTLGGSRGGPISAGGARTLFSIVGVLR